MDKWYSKTCLKKLVALVIDIMELDFIVLDLNLANKVH